MLFCHYFDVFSHCFVVLSFISISLPTVPSHQSLTLHWTLQLPPVCLYPAKSGKFYQLFLLNSHPAWRWTVMGWTTLYRFMPKSDPVESDLQVSPDVFVLQFLPVVSHFIYCQKWSRLRRSRAWISEEPWESDKRVFFFSGNDTMTPRAAWGPSCSLSSQFTKCSIYGLLNLVEGLGDSSNPPIPQPISSMHKPWQEVQWQGHDPSLASRRISCVCYIWEYKYISPAQPMNQS